MNSNQLKSLESVAAYAGTEHGRSTKMSSTQWLRQAQPWKLMHMGHLIRYAAYTLSLLIFVACGNWGWEAIDTDNEEKLNIFGLISLDDSLSSFVIVHKTLDTAGPDAKIVGYDTVFYEAWQWLNEDTGMFERDTFWYDPPYIRTLRESLYVVKDATVIISDGTRSYQFIRSPSLVNNPINDVYYDAFYTDPAIYTNTDSTFIPRPDTEYHLSITTPGGHQVTGSLTTPPIPVIKVEELADTLSINRLFAVNWQYQGDFNATISIGRTSQDWENYICGLEQFGVIEPGDTTWTSTIDSWCLENVPSEEIVVSMDLRLRYLDENYYRYFLASDDQVEDISNFLIGEGSIGTAYGIEGGFGVFGAFSADWVKRYGKP